MDIVTQFITLTSIDAVSGGEQEISAVLKRQLQDLGFAVEKDDAGNLYGILRGTTGQEPILFSAHMDTVQPGIGKKPQLEEGVIRSDGTTVLGADDICGITEILEGVRLVKDDAQGHGDIEVLFTVSEETYGKGAKAFDFGKIISEEAYVLDMSGYPGKAARKAPSIITFAVEITGRAAHAGYIPENGINALQAAAKAIAGIRQGKIYPAATSNDAADPDQADAQITVNIGRISAGIADNIVPERCVCSGEVRGFDHTAALKQIDIIESVFREETQKAGAGLEFHHEVRIHAYETAEDEEVCSCFQRACAQTGLEGILGVTHGGSDNNIFAQCGIKGIVLSCGMHNTHSTSEFTTEEELKKGSELVAAIVRNRKEMIHDYKK